MPFSVRHFTESDAPRVMSLVRLIRPEITEEDWVAFVTRTQGKGAGIVGIVDDDGYMYGLFSYRVSENLRYGWVLNVDDIVIAGLPGVKSISQALTDGMEALSTRFRCDHTVISSVDQSSGQDTLAASLKPFEGEGYVATGTWISKPVSNAAKSRRR